VDASNYTGNFSDQMMQDLKSAGIIGVIVQAVTGSDGRTYTTQQLQAASAAGFQLQGYVFPGGLDYKLPMFDGYNLEGLWLDLEIPITIEGVDEALAATDAYIKGVTGIYSGRWFFVQQGWLTMTKWADQGRPLWDSNYDGDAVVDDNFHPYGGWDHCVVKQYAGTSSVGSCHEIDLNVEA
jgi:hypothetical protein